ncbi:MAG: hypothetical protein WBM43_09615 [Flavobacteriaceae bacterium]
MSLPRPYEDFQKSLRLEHPPDMWPEGLKALWWEGRGNWYASRDIAQEINSDLGNWIHAYLHRKEGDDWNAGYWYQRAGRAFPKKSLEEDFQDLVLFVLDQ